MKTIIITIWQLITCKKAIHKLKVCPLSLLFPFFMLIANYGHAQIVYHDINPDLSGVTLTDSVLGQGFQWSMINGNLPKYSASLTDSLIMAAPGPGNMLLRLDAGDSIMPSSTWKKDAQVPASSTIVSVNKYLGFRVKDTSGGYRYGWFKIDVNSSSPQWVIKSYAYENTLNKYIIAGDTSNGGNDSSIAVTGITVTGQSGASAISVNGGTLQMIATVAPANATHQDVSWSVQNGAGMASISTTGLLTAQSNGTVTVKATAMDGSGVSGTKVITISGQTVGIADVNKLECMFYPNPAEKAVNLQFDREESIQNITIRNIVGKTMYVNNNVVKGKLINIPVDFLPEGLYILTYQNSAGGQGLYKFVKAK